MQHPNLVETGRANQAAPSIRLSPAWVVVLPLAGWAIVSIYLPVLGGQLSLLETWLAALLILVFGAVSLTAHLGGHLLAASIFRQHRPWRINLFPFGDASQGWAEPSAPRAQLGMALAGPLLNGLCAAAAYLVWNAQLSPLLSVTTLFTTAFNVWLALVNLIPAFPFDGGQMIRALMLATYADTASAARWVRATGFAVVAFLTAWGICLYSQHSRFSVETCGATFLFAVLVGLGLRSPTPYTDPDSHSPSRYFPIGIRAGLVGMLMLLLAVGPAGLLLTNNGIQAPGFALAVEPLVSVPAPYNHSHSGSFILTSVLEQAPILAGEWAISRFSPGVQIVPPEQIVPENSSLQEQARQGYQQLDESEATAEVIGLRLAGYPAELVGKGAEVMSILPDSPARAELQPGDVITGLNGAPIQTGADLPAQIKAQPHAKTVHLQIQRGGRPLELSVPLMPPANPGGAPRIGITLQTAGLVTRLPFPVEIHAQKIVGGPSAGLMFTLTVYNALNATDLTGGRKIAGTGTINPDGTVGPIGGVAQKVVAAEAAGASYFLSPVENYADARAAARRIKVIQVASAQEAVAFLRSLPRK